MKKIVTLLLAAILALAFFLSLRAGSYNRLRQQRQREERPSLTDQGEGLH